MLQPDHELIALGRSQPDDMLSVEAVIQDLSQGFDDRQLPADIDAIVHLAQSQNYRDIPAGLPDLQSVNVSATAALLKYAKLAGARQFVFASTGSIYEGGEVPQRESQPVVATSPYAISKHCGELLSGMYQDEFAITILRPFFLYGPGQNGMLIPRIIDCIQSGTPVILQGKDGGLELCPTFVEDAAGVFAAAIEGGIVGTYNLASPHVLNLEELANTIALQLGTTVQFERDESVAPGRYHPSLEALKQWYPVDGNFRTFESGCRDPRCCARVGLRPSRGPCAMP